MIKLLIKHAIYDHAISVFFDQVTYNLVLFPRIQNDKMILERSKREYLLRKWGSILDGFHNDVEPIHDKATASILATILENQAAYTRKESSSPGVPLLDAHVSTRKYDDD